MTGALVFFSVLQLNMEMQVKSKSKGFMIKKLVLSEKSNVHAGILSIDTMYMSGGSIKILVRTHA